MKFPTGVFRSLKPRHETYDFVWSIAQVILPDGRLATGLIDFDDTEWCFFEHEGVWRRAFTPLYRTSEEDAQGAVIDLRDRSLLRECEAAIAAYEAAIPKKGKLKATPDRTLEQHKKDLFRRLRYVEDMADQSGYNDHDRIARLHDRAWRLTA